MFIFYSAEVFSDRLILRSDDHHHCSKVLRKHKGEQIHVTDGKGHIFLCYIESINRDNTQCVITGTESQAQANPKVAIAIAPVKNYSRIEWFVEKATEIGVSDIYIMHTQRSEIKPVKKDRLEKIAVSAMKQSLKAYLPNILFFDKLEDCLTHTQNIYTDRFIGYCEDTDGILSDKVVQIHDTLVFIGPEGDFTPAEVEAARKVGVTPVSLGNSRLRTETAGIVALLTVRLKTHTL